MAPVATATEPAATTTLEQLKAGAQDVLARLTSTLSLADEPSTADILASLSLPEKVFLLSGTSFVRTNGLAKPGLHELKPSDGPTDIRGDTTFNGSKSIVLPNATCLASTFDVALIEKVSAVLGQEAKAKEVDILLAPTLNLHRDPRGGRNQESYGEDPFLAGKCGAAFVRGLASQGVPCCVKHLVCNDSETERRFYDVQVDEQVLREIYMRPFEIAVKEANPRSIMTAYNKINGKSAAQNAHTMSIVRDEWQWKGLFISDWFGTYDGVESIKAGLDLEMPFPAARGPNLLRAIQEGQLAESELDAPATRIIDLLRECKAPAPAKRRKEEDSKLGPEAARLNRQVAADGLVLLENDGILPLDARTLKSLAVIGPLATDDVITQLICPSYMVKPLAAIQEELNGSPVQLRHARGLQIHKIPPKLDERYSRDIRFTLWHNADRSGQPVASMRRERAIEALLTERPAELGAVFELEMTATVKVDVAGPYVLSIVAGAAAEVYIDEELVYRYSPDQVVDIQKFLFHAHQVFKTFRHTFDAGRQYQLRVVAHSQEQSGPEPVAQGLVVGMVEDAEREQLLAEAVAAAIASEAAVIFVGTTSEWEMEGVDRTDLRLPRGQDELIKAVLAANPRTIVVNQSGAAVDLSAAEDAAAVVHAHFAGQEAGHAIADVLFGKVNPSGRTTYTWPAELTDAPAAKNFPCKEDLSLAYAEGLDMGWRGVRKSGKKPSYPFGHGLSYTSFDTEFTSLQGMPLSGSAVRASVSVRNTGKLAGRHVVQLYVSKPDGSRSLEGVAKTTALAPGSGENLEVALDHRAFASWDTEHSRWLIRPGRYQVILGESAEVDQSVTSLNVDTETFWTGL